ncbi:glycosyltransferase [Lutibacter holmesii]|uniref:Glycosyltransferase n=1 Tax=Lutibacter holmesii TaxID=1137985 RepID=A0ABW3WMQ5_9FLAO
MPSVFLAVKKERKIVDEIIEKEHILGVISDNRFGVRSKKVPSVYITHQLQVLSGNTTYFTSKVHQKIWEKFDECWIPDTASTPNLSGKLGHLQSSKFKLKYIGILSRLNYFKTTLKYDLLVLLSGPEPQRSILESKVLTALKNYQGKVLFVRGALKNAAALQTAENIEVNNYLLSLDLEKAINESKLVLARSGYSTIMDLAVLGKKAFFIPTPGQFEQEYLAEKLSKESIAPFSTQDKFKIEDLKKANNFKGLQAIKSELNLNLFELFKGK